MFNHVVLYKNDLQPVFVSNEDFLNKDDIFVIVDDQIKKYKRNNFEYILHYDRNENVFIILTKYNNNQFAKKYFHNFEYAKDYFETLKN